MKTSTLEPTVAAGPLPTQEVLRVIRAARTYLERGAAHEAHFILAQAFHADTNRTMLGILANRILPCRMFAEALDGLRRLEWAEAGGTADYLHHPPVDEEIGKLVQAVPA